MKQTHKDPLILWAESPEEARNFINRSENSKNPISVETIYVAKRSGKSRSNNYVGGEYYKTTNDKDINVYNETINSPDEITKLVQWCTCDVMLSKGNVPCLVVEDTTHIVRMNLYQRIPRLVLAAESGVPSLVLQGTVGLDLSRRGDLWGFHRYLQAFQAIAKLFPNSPSLPIWYLPTPEDEERAQNLLFEHVSAVINNNQKIVEKHRTQIVSEINSTLTKGVEGIPPRDVPCIDYKGSKVIVRIGAKPDVKSWREKGSGQMDPYIGLIAAAKYIYCFDEMGNKVKDLIVEFTYLPEGFWFFENRENSTSLYKKLAFEIADEVRFLG